MCDCDAEYPSFINDSHPKAKKDHNCCECRGTIKSGETYHNYTGLWDGEFSTYKRCEDCFSLIEKIAKAHDGCNCISFGFLYREVDECREYLKEYVDIKVKRGAEIANWMLEESL